MLETIACSPIHTDPADSEPWREVVPMNCSLALLYQKYEYRHSIAGKKSLCHDVITVTGYQGKVQKFSHRAVQDILAARESEKVNIRHQFWIKESDAETSLVVQQIWTHLPMQGTRVRSLVWEDPTRRRATKPEHYSYWVHELQLLTPVRLEPFSRTPQQAEPPQWEAHAPQWRVAPTRHS